MIHLTLQERKVFLFLSFLFLSGIALAFLKKPSGCNFCLIDLYSKNATTRVLDINKAGRDELIALPGIGPKTADEIIAYRSSRGGIKDLSELESIKGMSEAKIERLKGYFKKN